MNYLTTLKTALLIPSTALLSATLLGVGGCISNSTQVPGNWASSDQYQSQDCHSLLVKRQALLNTEVSYAAIFDNSLTANHILGDGTDESALAKARGEATAVFAAMNAKNCRNEIPTNLRGKTYTFILTEADSYYGAVGDELTIGLGAVQGNQDNGAYRYLYSHSQVANGIDIIFEGGNNNRGSMLFDSASTGEFKLVFAMPMGSYSAAGTFKEVEAAAGK